MIYDCPLLTRIDPIFLCNFQPGTGQPIRICFAFLKVPPPPTRKILNIFQTKMSASASKVGTLWGLFRKKFRSRKFSVTFLGFFKISPVPANKHTEILWNSYFLRKNNYLKLLKAICVFITALLYRSHLYYSKQTELLPSIKWKSRRAGQVRGTIFYFGNQKLPPSFTLKQILNHCLSL